MGRTTRLSGCVFTDMSGTPRYVRVRSRIQVVTYVENRQQPKGRHYRIRIHSFSPSIPEGKGTMIFSSKYLKVLSFEIYDTVFELKKTVRATFILEVLNKSNNQDWNLVEVLDKVIVPFLAKTLSETSYDKFLEMAYSNTTILDVEDYVEVYRWIVEQYTYRPYAWCAEVVNIFNDNWELIDGRHLSKGVDLLRLIKKHNKHPERVFNLIDTVVSDFLIENAEDENRRNARDRLKYFRENGTIDTNWTGSDEPRHPDRTTYPAPTVPTENGYPGLEPPIG